MKGLYNIIVVFFYISHLEGEDSMFVAPRAKRTVGLEIIFL